MRTLIPYSIRRNTITLAALLVALATGASLGFLVPAITGQSLYRGIMIGLGTFILLGLVLSGAPRRILLIALAVAIPLNLAFSPFGKVPLHEGGAQAGFILYLYVLPAISLVGLLLDGHLVGT